MAIGRRFHVQLLESSHDNHRRSVSAETHRFQNRETMNAGINIDNDKPDIVHAAPKNFKSFPTIPGMSQAVTSSTRRICDHAS